MEDKDAVESSEAAIKAGGLGVKPLTNIYFAIIGGIGASIIGAGLWAGITVLTEHQIGYMAIGLGALVGFVVRYFGEGETKVFGVIGALISLFGSMLGNILSQLGFIAVENGQSVFELLTSIDYSYIPQLLMESTQPMDFLFYALAIYAGFRFSLNKNGRLPVAKVEANTQYVQYPTRKLVVLAGIIVSLVTGISLIMFSATKTSTGYYADTGIKQYEGRISWGNAEGLWIYWYEDGNKQAEINFQKSKKDGPSRFYYNNGALSAEENYKSGLLDGAYQNYYESGGQKIEGKYKNGRMSGTWKAFYEGGKPQYQGNYYLDLAQDNWIYWYENGNKQEEGVYNLGERDGFWSFWYESGQKKEELRYEDKRELILNSWGPKGEQQVKDGNGYYIAYNEDGRKKLEGQVKNGSKIGNWISWYNNGQRESVSHYLENEEKLLSFWETDGTQTIKEGNGVYSQYYNSGQTMISTLYVNGLLDGEYTIRNETGTIIYQATYTKGLLMGSAVSYFDNGTKSFEGNWINDKREDIWQWWNEEGLLTSKVMFQNDLKEGVQQFWENQEIIKEELYEGGKLIETRTF